MSSLLTSAKEAPTQHAPWSPLNCAPHPLPPSDEYSLVGNCCDLVSVDSRFLWSWGECLEWRMGPVFMLDFLLQATVSVKLLKGRNTINLWLRRNHISSNLRYSHALVSVRDWLPCAYPNPRMFKSLYKVRY